MRIVLLTRALGAGGTETQLVLLAAGLADRGHVVTVVTLYPGGLGWNRLHLRPDVKIRCVTKRGPADSLRAIWQLRRILIEERPDAIYSFLFVAAVHSMLAAIGLPVRKIVGLRGSSIDFNAYGVRYRWTLHLGLLAANRADRVIVNSYRGLEDYVQIGLRSDKTTVIPNGIDSTRFSPSPSARQMFRKEHGFRETDLVVAVVGRLDPMKGHEDLLRACSRLSDGPQIEVLIVGDGPDAFRAHLERLAVEFGLSARVRWLPVEDAIERVYAASDLLCLPSRFGEGFSNVVGEAMACETVPVVTDVGDAHRIVGEAGFVVPARDPEALGAVLRRAASLAPIDRSQIGRAARQRIVKHFAIPQMIEQTEKILVPTC